MKDGYAPSYPPTESDKHLFNESTEDLLAFAANKIDEDKNIHGKEDVVSGLSYYELLWILRRGVCCIQNLGVHDAVSK